MMKKTILTKILTAAFVLSLGAAGLTGCGSNSSESEKAVSDEGGLTTVRYGVMSASVSQWFTEIGTEKGIWEKYNIQIEQTEFAAGINTVDAIVTGQGDVGFVADFAGVNRIGSTADETDLRLFAQVYNGNGYQFYANPDTLTSLDDLSGKKISVQPGTVIEYWDGVILGAQGLTKDDVTYQTYDGPTELLAMAKTGDIDGSWASGENAKRLQEEYGWEAIVSAKDMGINTYGFFIASDEYLKNNQETVINLLKAQKEIDEWVIDNMDEAAEIINEKDGVEENVFKTTVEAGEYSIEFTQEAYDDLDKIAGWAYENGFYDNEISIGDFINTDALKAIDSSYAAWTAK